MKTMKAVSIYSFGGPATLKFADVPRPHPGEGEVVVRVHAAGVNPIDWKLRDGQFKDSVSTVFPVILGWEFSGVVDSLGTSLKHLRVGDAVLGKLDLSQDGAYADYVLVREDEVALKPVALDHLHAAALPMAGLTAWQALFEAAELHAGQRILIHAGAGGVGHLAVQLAKSKGAWVVATASSHNHAFVKQLGADQVIDSQADRFEQVVAPVDVVLDTVGGDTQERSWQVLKPGGILVSIVSPPSPERAAEQGVRQAWVVTKAKPDSLLGIAKLASLGLLKVCVESVFPLAEAKKAQELSKRGPRRGKIVLEMIPEPDPLVVAG